MAAGQNITADAADERSVAERQFRRRPSAYLMAPSPSSDKFLGFMISASGLTRGDRVLDVACGTGSATLAFAERCAGVVGIDVVSEPLQRARRESESRKLANVEFAQSEVERLAFIDSAFTGAICRFSFHHFLNPKKVFAEMLRVVEPGGWMMIADMTAPDDPEQAGLHNRMERLCDPTHARALPVAEFEQMFAAYGFRVAMAIARDSRLAVEDWLRFGGTSPENAAKLRTMVTAALESGRPSRFLRDGGNVRVVHTSVSFVIESTA